MPLLKGRMFAPVLTNKNSLKMKKILTVVIALITITTASAQVKKGLRAGYAMSSVSGTDAKFDVRSTYYVGFFSEFKSTERIAVQAEIMYSPAGTKFPKELVGKGNDVSMNFGTLSVPLFLKYYVSPSFSLHVGPSFGFNLYRKVKFEGESVDSKELIKTFNFAGLVGFEYALDSGLFFDARYTIGANNISKLDGVTMRNNLLTFGLGYKF